MRQRLLVLVASCVAALAGLVGPAPAVGARHAAGRTPDLVTVRAYDYYSDQTAATVRGETATNLSFRLTVGTPLVDGTLTVDVPRRAWPTPLVAITDSFSEIATSDQGKVGVRPGWFARSAPADCRGSDDGGPDPVHLAIVATPGGQRIVASHLDCVAGASIEIRVRSIHAPVRPGRYRFPVTVRDRGPRPVEARTSLSVSPPTRVHFTVQVAPTITIRHPFAVRIRAWRGDGRPATGYRGRFAIDVPHDCTIDPFGTMVHTFTAADAGVKTVTATVGSLQGPDHLVVRDVSHTAADATSPSFEVVGPLTPISCPVAFH